MDTSSIIIGVITLIICAIPFVWVSRGNQKRRNKNLKSLTDWTIENNLKLDKIESHSDFILGLDTNEKTFVFFKESNESKFEKIPLSNVAQVNLVKETTLSNDTNGLNSRIAKVSLGFSLKPSGSSTIQIELFNVEKNHQLSGEIQLGQDWAKHINSIL